MIYYLNFVIDSNLRNVLSNKNCVKNYYYLVYCLQKYEIWEKLLGLVVN